MERNQLYFTINILTENSFAIIVSSCFYEQFLLWSHFYWTQSPTVLGFIEVSIGTILSRFADQDILKLSMCLPFYLLKSYMFQNISYSLN